MIIPDGHLPLRDLEEENALRTIVEGIATETGEKFFTALARNLQRALGTAGAWVTEYFEDKHRLRALAFYMDNRFVDGYELDITGTPCELVIKEKRLIHFPDRLIELFPRDPDFNTHPDIVSYMGIPLCDIDGRVLGHMAVVDRKVMPEDPRATALFRIFAGRAAAEMQRLRAEKQVREREEKLSRLVNSAMDAIIELDDSLRISQMNPAAEKVFGCSASEVTGRNFSQFIAFEDRVKLIDLIAVIDSKPEGQRHLWIGGGLRAVRADGSEFPAEATIARFDVNHHIFHTLVLRNVNERLEAEKKIHTLTAEAEYLREEIRALQNFDEIIGESEPLLRALADVRQVAETDASVLILGETGTGKELFARAIHAGSRRNNRPLIRVNCAAIPSQLMESEFFGHERGAFTGATHRREGRFALADGGTLFLDEIGELSLDLQAKLLRVLQEGEFEPVGSSQTRKVNVRVLAATNRDLLDRVKAGQFREDLYYRLNVFPIKIPALRERADDIPLIAAAFVERFARHMGRKIEPLTADCIRKLRAYPWPGNVRELQNVIERAVIISRDGRLDLDRCLPGGISIPSRPELSENSNASDGKTTEARIRTADEMLEFERQNILAALEQANWRVSGDRGAARILNMNPSTLSSRIKALGIPRRR